MTAYLNVKFGEDVSHDEPYDGKPPDFFDREVAKEHALAILRSPQTQRAVWLVGERRAGKTSMLKLLLQKCKQEGFLAIEVPWQSIYSAENFHREFLAKLDGALSTEKHLLPNPPISFWQALHERQQQIGQPTLVVGIDEIDAILLEQTDENSKREILGDILRLVAQEPKIKVILASARPASKIEQLKASPLVSKSEEIPIPPFSEADLAALIRSLAPHLSDIEVTQIYRISGGWPFYAKSILYHLLQLPDEARDLGRARSEAVKSISSTCDHLYRHHWNEDEKRALWLLTNKEQITREDFERLDASLRAAMQELTQRGYLLKENERFHFRVLLISDWLKGWTRRELEEEKLDIPSLLKKLRDPWAKEPGEQTIQITKEDLRRRGF